MYRISRLVFMAGVTLAAMHVTPAGAQLRKASRADWIAQDEVFYQIFVRSFRDSDGDRIGDLRGIQDGLDYLQKLGVTSLLLTPINPSPFYHNYFADSFEGVDPEYGDARTFAELVKAVHARNMKLYLDQEIQYVAQDHPWLKESLGQPGSRYSRYIPYHGPGNTNPESAVMGLTVTPMYNGEKINLATINLLEPEVRTYFGNLFASLLDPNGDGRFDDGVDGFRIDHMMDDLDAKGLFKNLFADFWAPIFAQVRATNPRAKIIAEQADWGFGGDFLTRGGADMVFAFPIRQAVVALSRQGIADAVNQTVAKMPAGKGLLVFIENHDVNRFASEMGDLRKQKIGAALNILLKGTPLIYYGQEIGMKGKRVDIWSADGNDIPDREAFEWTRKVASPTAALWYKDSGPWWTNRYAKDDDGISVEEEIADSLSLLSFYRQLLLLRRQHTEIVSGDQQIVTTNRNDVLAVVRAAGGQASLLLINLADQPASVTLPVLHGVPLMDLIACRPEAAGGSIALAPYGIKLLKAVEAR